MSIVHYFNQLYEDAMAEVIPYGKLKESMTNHGLGSGFYGFIDISDKNTRVGLYRTDNYDMKIFELKNPLILDKNDTRDEDGEIISDNVRFSRLSHALNHICYHIIYNNIQIDEINIEKINDILKPLYYPNMLITNFFSPSLHDIIKSTILFILDYRKLMLTKSSDEHYVLMPINYLLYLYGYDGIYNLGGDVASRGSVKYFFDKEYLCRGYPVFYKTRIPMKGKLIFFENKK